ncbi:MAG: FAD-binding protein [Kibdelosporangium sp.]
MIFQDEPALAWAAADYGQFVSIRPRGVLRPSTVAEIRAAALVGLPLRARGQGHSTAGQAQQADAIVVDMRGLNAIHEVTSEQVVVDAGARWSEVLAATLPKGRTPPVLTDYLELSVGGTISAGGIGGATHRHGLVVDNVASLEVLTPDGEIHTCGPCHPLFDAVRAGQGSSGIILRASLRLTPAPARACRYLLHYADLASFLADQRLLMASRRFSYLEGQAKPGRHYEIEAVSHYSPPAQPDAALLLEGLSHNFVESVEDLSYFEFLNRLASGEEFLRSVGDWDRPHPWSDVFLPDHAADGFLASFMAELTVDDVGENGVILIYPFDTGLMTAPRLRVPATPVAFLLAVLRTAPDTGPGLARMLAGRQDLRARALAAEGTIYLD